ncbi:CrcB family protein [Actinocorallia sp. A-T 12471]|uniref:fluoride efflux transporter FluC n=1 Tax=Actinocorallia sp. A-T 12471 TaxID=3089813 RepID=UPI0029D0978A|nr:CrcB family protein [Actinocorallia sp. A-T 12471]MDX6741419.1 CrcB family protein [Actinocorallia sp. A-T 12471]
MTDDEDKSPPARARAEFAPAVLAVVALGGSLGAVARWGLVSLFPSAASAWAVLGVNVSGALLMGVLMAAVTEVPSLPRLTRPFLGVGVLGGYTTFSTYTADVLALDRFAALACLVLTPVTALAAVAVGVRGARAVLRR